MADKDASSLPHVSLQTRYAFLLASLLLMFVIFPFFRDTNLGEILLSVIVLIGLYSVIEERRFFVLAVLLALLALGVSWLAYFAQVKALLVTSLGIRIAFFTFTAGAILIHVLREQQVTGEIICGAICVYLFLGLIWALVFAVLEVVQPGTFAGGGIPIGETEFSPGQKTHLWGFVYYSFITLTTLGYGDITPETHPARALAALEAIVGQLYIAVLIARLVALHIVGSRPKQS